MSDNNEQPKAVWVFPPDKRKQRKRLWLIILAVVVVIAIAGVIVWAFVIPRDSSIAPTPSTSPTASASPTPTPTPTRSATPSPTSTATSEPEEPSTEPSEPGTDDGADADVTTFANTVNPRLTDAATGLGMLEEGMDPASVIGQLQGDAMWMADATAPASISEKWDSAIDAYLTSLTALNDASASGKAPASAIADTRSRLNALTAILGD